MNEDAEGEGWLLEVEVTDESAIEELMDEEKY